MLQGSQSQKHQSCPNSQVSVLEKLGICVLMSMVEMRKEAEPRPEKMGSPNSKAGCRHSGH